MFKPRSACLLLQMRLPGERPDTLARSSWFILLGQTWSNLSVLHTNSSLPTLSVTTPPPPLHRSIKPNRPDALVLIGMLVALRLAVYYTLRVKTRTRKMLME